MGTNDVRFGDRLRRGRELLGWSRAEAAAAIGVSSSQVLRYEKDGATVPLYVAVRLADALGVSLDGLIGRDSPGPMIAISADDHTVLITPEKQVFHYHGDLPVTSRRGTEAEHLPDLRRAAQAAIESARQAQRGGRRQGDPRRPAMPDVVAES